MRLLNWFKKSDYILPVEEWDDDTEDELALEYGQKLVDEMQFPEYADPTEIRESSRRYASHGYDHTFWYDDINDILHLSGLGNTHEQLLDEFGEDLGWQGRYSGTTIDWYGMEGFIPLEGQKKVTAALSKRFDVIIKTADKLNDFLMNPKSRPDLQTPEAQALLQTLQEKYHSAKTDKMLPWVVREWKKGRIKHDRAVRWAPGTRRDDVEGRLAFENNEGYHSALNPERLDHWADWLGSDHPEAKGDLMRHQIHDVDHHVQDWDQQMKDRAHQEALEGGDIIHQFPNGWSVRNLTTPDQLQAEGDAMGHCCGEHGYVNSVANGSTIIHSLRDERNSPHATIEYEPTDHEDELHPWDHPGAGFIPKVENAVIKQIQGKGNEVPKPEYQAMLKDYFSKFPDETRPNWEHRYNPIDTMPELARHYKIPDIDQYGHEDYYEGDMGGYGPHGDYGLIEPDRTLMYGDLIKNIIRPKNSLGWHDKSAQTYEPHEVDHLYNIARQRNEIPELAKGLKDYSGVAMDDYSRLEGDSFHDMPDYPGESYEEEPDRWSDQEKFDNAKEEYDYARNRLYESHQPSQLVNHLYQKINPHWDGLGYQSEPVPTPPPEVKSQTPRPLAHKKTDWFELKPTIEEVIPKTPEPQPIIEHKIVDPNAEVIEELQAKVAALTAKLEEKAVPAPVIEQSIEKKPRKLVIHRDENGKMSSIEEV